MNIRIIGSTKYGYVLPTEDAHIFSGHASAICYMKGTYDKVIDEPKEKTFERLKGNIEKGHHSVTGHVQYNLYLENIPKILAMFLNNEGIYNTSEKSARYTDMVPLDEEKEIYEKWKSILSDLISEKMKIDEKYSRIDKRMFHTLVNENARYMISIFNPYVSMEYTASLQQLNYINYFSKLFVNKNKDSDDPFLKKCSEVLSEFSSKMPDIFSIPNLNPEAKSREFSLIGKRRHYTEFGENFSINYEMSFACFAQSHRHRRDKCEFMLKEEPKFYVPEIIKGTKYEEDWLKDISSLAHLYPQGMLIDVNERGTIEDFVLYCKERLCGRAQLEIALKTKEAMARYIEEVKDKPLLYNYLLPYTHGPKCTFYDFTCKEKCIFGPKYGTDRIL